MCFCTNLPSPCISHSLLQDRVVVLGSRFNHSDHNRLNNVSVWAQIHKLVLFLMFQFTVMHFSMGVREPVVHYCLVTDVLYNYIDYVFQHFPILFDWRQRGDIPYEVLTFSSVHVFLHHCPSAFLLLFLLPVCQVLKGRARLLLFQPVCSCCHHGYSRCKAAVLSW